MSVKYCEKCDTKEGSDAVGKEVEAVADASRDEILLHDFCHSAVGDADDGSQQQGFLAVALPVVDVLSSIAPNAKEGEDGVHEEMHHLVGTDDGLDMG